MSNVVDKDLKNVVYKALDDKKGNDIKVLDISKISVMADYFVIASGSNKNQVQALADNVEEEMLKLGIHARQVEGYPSGNWILMDYDDFIVHVFNQDDRLFYDLERIWKDGELVELA